MRPKGVAPACGYGVAPCCGSERGGLWLLVALLSSNMSCSVLEAAVLCSNCDGVSTAAPAPVQVGERVCDGGPTSLPGGRRFLRAGASLLLRFCPPVTFLDFDPLIHRQGWCWFSALLISSSNGLPPLVPGMPQCFDVVAPYWVCHSPFSVSDVLFGLLYANICLTRMRLVLQ